MIDDRDVTIQKLRHELAFQKAYREDMKNKVRDINNLLGVSSDQLSDLHQAVIDLAAERDKYKKVSDNLDEGLRFLARKANG